MIFLASILAAFTTPSGDVTSVCGPAAQMTSQLTERWGQVPRATGLAATGVLFQIFVSPDGNWTLVISDPTGRACVLETGVNWENYPIPKTGTEG